MSRRLDDSRADSKRRSILDANVTVEPGPMQTMRWRDIAAMLAGAVLEIAKALHRIASEMERRG